MSNFEQQLGRVERPKKFPNHICPCCHNPLTSDDDGSGRFIAWCAVGRCPSEMGDRGALSDTPEQAADSLIQTMNTERDWLA